MQRLGLLAIVAVVLGVVLGLGFAGSSGRIAAGVKIDGVNVGGLTAGQARAKLERRADALSQVPVTFTAVGHDVAPEAGQPRGGGRLGRGRQAGPRPGRAASARSAASADRRARLRRRRLAADARARPARSSTRSA